MHSVIMRTWPVTTGGTSANAETDMEIKVEPVMPHSLNGNQAANSTLCLELDSGSNILDSVLVDDHHHQYKTPMKRLLVPETHSSTPSHSDPRSGRRESVRFSVVEDIQILHEVLTKNPFECPSCWNDIADNMRTESPKVYTAQNVRLRVDRILKSVNKNEPQVLVKSWTKEEWAERNILLEKVKSMKESASSTPKRKRSRNESYREERKILRLESAASLPGKSVEVKFVKESNPSIPKVKQERDESYHEERKTLRLEYAVSSPGECTVEMELEEIPKSKKSKKKQTVSELKKKPKSPKQRVNINGGYFEKVVHLFDDDQFLQHFRVSRKVAADVARRFAASEKYKPDSGPYGNISALEQTLVFLWFTGHQTGSFRQVADRFKITISSLHRITRRLTYFLSSLSESEIKWPTQNEKRIIAQRFGEMGFLNAIGAIDGCHVRICRPAENHSLYINRIKYHSIQLQVTCDDKMRITSLFVGSPGSLPAAQVFKTSPLHESLPEQCGEYFILGNNAYPCSRNLVTPFRDGGTTVTPNRGATMMTGRGATLTWRQKRFNKTLDKCRTCIESCLALLKTKFRQLHHCKIRNNDTIAHFVKACCVLHNLAIEDEFSETAAEDELEAVVQPVDVAADVHLCDEKLDDADGTAFRNVLLSNSVFD